MITNEVVNRAISYIMEHIGEEITIEEVADYCHFSKFYFSRMFKEETGESLYAFIKRVKMEQSAFRLKVDPERSITQVGYEYGYSSSNYSSVFKNYHKTSPVAFRKNIYRKSLEHPFYSQQKIKLESYIECCRKIPIENIKDLFVIYERRIGTYYNLGEEWCTFMEKYQKYINKDTLLLERTFDDPSITRAGNCLYDICMSVDCSCQLENTCIIHGGKFAVYHFKGIAQQIYSAYQSLFQVWLPQSIYEMDERYGFDIYREVDGKTGSITMDIYMPVK